MAVKTKPPAKGGKGGGFGAAVSKFGKQFDAVKGAKSGAKGDDEVDEGDYYTRLSSARCGVSKKKEPYVSLNFVVVRGPFAKKKLSRFSSIREKQAEQDFEYLCKDFDRLGYDTSELKVNEVEDLVKDLNKSKPFVLVNVVHQEGEGKNAGRTFQRVYLQKVVKEADLPAEAKKAPAKKK